MLQKLFCDISTVSNRFGDFFVSFSFVDSHIAYYYRVGSVMVKIALSTSSFTSSELSNTRSIRISLLWTSRKNNLELIEFSSINKVSLV